MILLVAVGAALVLVLVSGDLVFRPVFRRLAVRNALRRPNEALLIVLGSVLGTAIVTSSFVVGDTLHATIRDEARTRLGPIDEIVLVHDAGQVSAAAARITGRPFPGVDGVLTEVTANAAVTTAADRPGGVRTEPDAFVHEVDFGAARAFGGRPQDTGLAGAGATPVGDEAVVGADLARELGLRPGDRLDLHAYGQTRTFRVRDVVPRLGIAGFHPGFAITAPNIFVAPGTLGSMASSAPAGSQLPEGRVLVSNDGGVFDSTAHSAAIVRELQTRTAGIGSNEVTDEKAQTLAFAERQGANFSRLFGLIGSFTVAAGVLLLVNIFVMLAEERKSELGTMRALGFKRNHLVRVFGLEGNLYSVVAALLGAVAGIGVGRVVVRLTQSIFEEGSRGVTSLHFAVRPGSLLAGFAIGLGISLVTVWVTSVRIGRLNIIRAIHDAPEPPRRARNRGREALARVGVLAGAAITAAGVIAREPFASLIGPALVGCSAVPLLEHRISRRAAVTLVSLTVLGFTVIAFPLLPSVFDHADITIFFVQGVILVLSGVVLAVNNDQRVRAALDRLGGAGHLARRLGLANPLARRVRTGLVLGMYALIVFVLVFMAIFAAVLRAQAPRAAEQAAAGYDLRVDSNVGNPVSATALQQDPGVESTSPLVVSVAQFQPDGSSVAYQQRLTGFDATLLAHGVPTLSSRDPRYRTDEEAWRAVLDSPDLVIVPSTFLSSRVGPLNTSASVGEHLTLIDPSTGRRHRLTIVGLDGDLDPAENGAMVAARNVPLFVDRSASSRFYVATRAGADPVEVAAALERDLVANGVDAQTFRALVDEHLRGQAQFISLLEGYLAMGLAIGVAGLGVVMIRAVRERRHEIGALRALGVSARTVRRAFLVEAGFLATQGIVIGAVLGTVTGYSVLSNTSTFGDQQLPFTVPWVVLVALGAGTLLASLLAVAGPANQASRITPAVALRVAD